MRRNPVSSSNIKSIGYDATGQLLEVEFNGGGVHQYAGVPQDLADKFVRAQSIGTFFHMHIRDRFKSKAVESEAA
jgi:hypothetical protein